MKKSMWFGAGLLAVLAGPVQGDEVAAWRIVVGDQAAPVVQVLDFADGRELARYDLAGPAALTAGPAGRLVYAAQGSAGQVAVIDTGIGFESHGDHAHLLVTPPRLLDARFEGKKPSHLVGHDGRMALFFDGEGAARIVAEHAILDGKAEPREIRTAAPHHGVAAAIGRATLVSVPHPERPAEELPIGIEVRDEAGARVGDLAACRDLHGEAASGDLTAFACAEGVLLATVEDGAPVVRRLDYPAALPAGKATTLDGGRSLRWFLGNWGPSAVVLIDPSADEAFRLVTLPSRRVTFAIDPVRSARAFVVTEDGQLHRLNALTGKIDASARLTGPYSMDGHWRDPRPRLAFADGRLLVSDPNAARILVVAPDTLAVERTIPVDGLPYTIVAVGGVGEGHH